MTLDQELIDVIIETLKAQGKSQAALARHLGKDPAQVTRLLKPNKDGDEKSSKKASGLTVRDLQQIFQFLGLEISRDMLVSPRKVYVKLAPVRGTVAHGVWREREMLPKSRLREIPFPGVPQFSQSEQHAYEVADSHAEDYVPPDAYIICVRFLEARTLPKHNDILVIERQSTFPAATRNVITTERALRQAFVTNDGIILKALSSGQDVDDIPYDPSNPPVTITDLVLGWFNFSPNTLSQ